ncbi:MAG TPA: hypothetical protein DDZ42_05400 [Candidatus Rokubacteria bacterium]|nr:MAG: hypothetical protein A2050_13790 [Candidatus Rokubacteria bacterium GWA2_73_35]HBH01351.1 hypothetical protein [Candidatus Rokubacteria bacterium]
MALTILADDLTGACDSGALLAGRAAVPVTVWPAGRAAGAVSVVDTESRGLGAAEAAARVERAVAAARGAGGAWFKKIDSTLRGPVGAEIGALLRAAGVAGALVTPAFPAERRVVQDGVLRVDGAAAAHVVETLRPALDRPVACLPLAQVRAGPAALAARLRRLTGTVAVADAETEQDLAALVDAALAAGPAAPLLAGSAGLAGALARRLGLAGPPPALPPGGRWLVVAGSRHPATHAQVAAARRAGLEVLAAPAAPAGDPREVAAALAAEARRALDKQDWDLVVVTGGDTAVALYQALDAERIDLLGAPRAGLALGRLRTPARAPLVLLTKAGGFGAPDLLVALHAEPRA